MPDPVKKKSSSKAVTRSNDIGMMLSDKLAKKVHNKKMTRGEAVKAQRSQDSIAKSVKKVGYKKDGGSQKTSSKRTYGKAKYRLDRNGNMEAY